MKSGFFDKRSVHLLMKSGFLFTFLVTTPLCVIFLRIGFTFLSTRPVCLLMKSGFYLHSLIKEQCVF